MASGISEPGCIVLGNVLAAPSYSGLAESLGSMRHYYLGPLVKFLYRG